MKVNTRYFGEIEIGEEKVIHFEDGLLGFEQYKDYTIIYDVEAEDEPFFSWMQCVTEQSLAFPVVNPLKVCKDYNPVVEDELLAGLGDMQEDDLVVFLLATVPQDVQKTSVNMKAPLVINAGTRRGIQIVAENEDYEVKHYLIKE